MSSPFQNYKKSKAQAAQVIGDLKFNVIDDKNYHEDYEKRARFIEQHLK
jgi:hypothetical protein